jgi:Heterokaryon incompatibility protein (HET)
LRGSKDVRLLDSKGKKGKYAALSHCWGTMRSITTLRKNIEEHLERIRWQSLPKTFQDAIDYVRRLELDSLWIDSVCIVQDDKADWRRESANMASIYQNAFITIAATKSLNDEGGCYSTKSPLNHDYLVSSSDQQNLVYVREKLLHFDEAEDQQMMSNFPLLTRGWAYQERLLSPRVLHFCHKEIIWECLEKTTCECTSFDPTTKPKIDHFSAIQTIERGLKEIAKQKQELQSSQSTTYPPSRAMFWSTLGFRPNISVQTSPSAREAPLDTLARNRARASELRRLDEEGQLAQNLLQAKWQEIVQEYSKLSLTVASDRLPALAGLSKQAEACRNGPYMAGLWHDSIERDILWYVERLVPGSPGARPEPTQAPSWSWAAVNSPVMFLNDPRSSWRTSGLSFEQKGRLLDASDSFPLVITNWSLEPAGVSYSPSLGTNYERQRQSGDYKLFLRESNITPFYADYHLEVPGSNYVANGEMVFCLEVVRGESAAISLVLRRLKHHKILNRFERIGIVLEKFNPSKSGAIVTISKVADLAGSFRKNMTDKLYLV